MVPGVGPLAGVGDDDNDLDLRQQGLDSLGGDFTVEVVGAFLKQHRVLVRRHIEVFSIPCIDTHILSLKLT